MSGIDLGDSKDKRTKNGKELDFDNIDWDNINSDELDSDDLDAIEKHQNSGSNK